MATDITWTGLLLSYLCMILPIMVQLVYQTGLVKPTLWAMLRMTLQLMALGLYLRYIFEKNLPWINFAWVLTMTLLTTSTILKRGALPKKIYWIPVLLSLWLTLGFILVLLVPVIGSEVWRNAQYLIPLSGMMMGNMLSHSIMGVHTYHHSLMQQKGAYQWRLACGASKSEAIRPIVKDAIVKGINPLIASMSVMGLVSLPGMMTGQILGGNSPDVAVKYQIVIMLAIFSASVCSIWISLKLAERVAFDAFDNYIPSLDDGKE